jgi:hypothetical protein
MHRMNFQQTTNHGAAYSISTTQCSAELRTRSLAGQKAQLT